MIAKTFVHQLHSILAEPNLTELIGWAGTERNDDAFYLKPYHNNFPDHVLKRYFKHGNVSSFVRQLHMYGFHKLPNTATNKTIQTAIAKNDPNIKLQKSDILWYFVHPSGFFTKTASKEILGRIQRKTTGIGKDGKRRNVLSPVCVNFIDSNGTAIYSPQLDSYQQQQLQVQNLQMNHHVRGNHPMEIHMANQLNMVNTPYERSNSCINIPINGVRTPVTRTNSQPLIRMADQNLKYGQRISHPSMDMNSTYYNNNSNNNNTINPLSNIHINNNNNSNNNSSRYTHHHQMSLPLQPTGNNVPPSSSIMPLPYMTSITPSPSPMAGLIPQNLQYAQQHVQQQPIFKQSVFHNSDHSTYTIDDGTTPQITRQSSFSTGSNHPMPDSLTSTDSNNGPAMTPPPILPKLPQTYPLPAMNQPNSDDTQSKPWNQQRVATSSTYQDTNVKPEQPVLPRMSVSTSNSDTTANKDAAFQKISNIMKVANDTTKGDSVQEGLGSNIENLMKSIVVVIDILDKLQPLKESSESDSTVNPLDKQKSEEKLEEKLEGLKSGHVQLDELLNMLSDLRTKLINNNDIIAENLNTDKELKTLTTSSNS